MIALVPVRDGELPLGAAEVVAEASGRVLLAGSGVTRAADALGGVAVEIRTWETPSYRPAAWGAALAPACAGEDLVLLPASPDGRDLAPRLAHTLGWPLYAPAMGARPGLVTVIRGGGLRTEQFRPPGRYVATLQPGVRGVGPAAGPGPTPHPLDLAEPAGQADPRVVGLLPADPATVGLADARRIFAVGGGLGSHRLVDLAAAVATALGASFGATRVVTDAGWAPHHRQIGTTGVVVAPELYVALGISGAVQHVSGIGQPAAVVAVNTDASCPMMAMADLALVTDATLLVRELARRLEIAGPNQEPVPGEAPNA